MAFSIHLSDFDGPLDMLLYLIGRAKVDIKDIFVSEVTQQYIDYVSNAPDLDLDDASGFLAMAATLLEIKSRSLLPREPREGESEQEDPAQALIRQLEEYPLPPPSYELDNLTMDGLIEAFARVLARTHVDTAEEEKERRISRDQFSVPRCMAAILRRLNRGQVRFSDLFDEHVTRDEVVSTFLALLELLKAGRASVVQDATYAEILIGPAKPETHEAAEEGEPDDDGRP